MKFGAFVVTRLGMGNQTSGKLSFDDISYQLNCRRYKQLPVVTKTPLHTMEYLIICIINVSFDIIGEMKRLSVVDLT